MDYFIIFQMYCLLALKNVLFIIYAGHIDFGKYLLSALKTFLKHTHT